MDVKAQTCARVLIALQYSSTPLHHAHNELAVVRYLVEECGANVNAKVVVGEYICENAFQIVICCLNLAEHILQMDSIGQCDLP
jgi:hypothetical protein